jgi:hypothetical protein
MRKTCVSYERPFITRRNDLDQERDDRRHRRQAKEAPEDRRHTRRQNHTTCMHARHGSERRTKTRTKGILALGIRPTRQRSTRCRWRSNHFTSTRRYHETWRLRAYRRLEWFSADRRLQVRRFVHVFRTRTRAICEGNHRFRSVCHRWGRTAPKLGRQVMRTDIELARSGHNSMRCITFCSVNSPIETC